MQALVTVLCLVVMGFPAQPPKNVNMRTTAAETGSKDVQNWLSENIDPIGPKQLFAAADTVVSGRVGRVLCRLADDAMFVVTEYEIVPSQFVKRDPRLDSAPTPARTAAFLVRRVGGSTVEGDVRYTTMTIAYPNRGDLTVGEDVVLFLAYDKEGKAYTFAGGPYGVYRVRSGQVVAMKRPDRTGEESLGNLGAFLQSIHPTKH